MGARRKADRSARSFRCDGANRGAVKRLQPAATRQSGADWLVRLLWTTWIIGLAVIVLTRVRLWHQVRALIRISAPVEIADAGLPEGIHVRTTPGILEPGVVGWLRPILLLPADIRERLSPFELKAVLAHEWRHIRRDNLTAGLHLIVEAVFWFHPLVWWIGTRLLDERERACDQEVLRLGNEALVYAEGILRVCRTYLASPLRCVSGVMGSSLKKRVESILSGVAVMVLVSAEKPRCLSLRYGRWEYRCWSVWRTPLRDKT